MSATPPNLGVAAPSSTPPAPTPAWPDAAQLPVVSPVLSNSLPNTWPRPVLWLTAGLLLIALSLLGWNVYASSRWATRPTMLERSAFQASRLDLNRADRVQLLQLPGVGETLAARIEEYRNEHRGFRNVEELRQVHGIGPVMLEKLRPLVYVESVDADEDTEPGDDPPRPSLTRPAPKSKPDKPATTTTKKTDELKGLIDINRASAEELQRLPRIGPAMSSRIIAAREHKPFKTVDDLRHVSGIGAKTLEQLRPFVTVGEPVAEKKD
jgi:competence protein ComEA